MPTTVHQASVALTRPPVPLCPPKAAVRAGAEHRRTVAPTVAPAAMEAPPVRTKRRQKGRLGLGRVNAYRGRIEARANGRCRGVVMRHLPSQLGWHRAMLRVGLVGEAVLDRALLAGW